MKYGKLWKDYHFIHRAQTVSQFLIFKGSCWQFFICMSNNWIKKNTSEHHWLSAIILASIFYKSHSVPLLKGLKISKKCFVQHSIPWEIVCMCILCDTILFMSLSLLLFTPCKCVWACRATYRHFQILCKSASMLQSLIYV